MSTTEALALIARTKKVIADTEDRRKALEYAGARAGAKAEELVGEYPLASGKPLAVWYERTTIDGRTYKSKFKSFRQQRKVMALVAAGKVPYKRGGLLGRNITSEAHAIGTGVVIRVGTLVKYAKYVIGKEEQSNYHKPTWTPLVDHVEQGKKEILAVFTVTLRGYLKGYVAGHT